MPRQSFDELAYNARRAELYLYSQTTQMIVQLSLESRSIRSQTTQFLLPTGLSSLVSGNLPRIRSMVYDVNTDQLYWVDERRGSLEVALTGGAVGYRKVLRHDLGNPVSLALDAESRTWFVGLDSVKQVSLQCRRKKNLSQTSLFLPQSR